MSTPNITVSPATSPGASAGHRRTSSDRDRLNIPGGVSTLHSPTSTKVEESTSEPPSPTPSNSSANFTTSTALRENDPEKGVSHTTTSDHSAKNPSQGANNNTNMTTTPNKKSMDLTTKKKKSEKNESDSEKLKDGDKPKAVELMKDDENLDMGPFTLKPYDLAHQLDPAKKQVDNLKGFGGVVALLEKLGTNPTSGLSKTAIGAGAGASQRHDRTKEEPELAVTDPKEGSDSGPAYNASLQLRRDIYGKNELPQQKSKSLIRYMILAMKDKVLILLSIAAIVSLALGLYEDLRPDRPKGEAQVNWVEGFAIIVAIFIVDVVGSLNDWQKERQFKKLNAKREERGIKVIRGGVEQVIDIKELVVGDVALVEPGEIVPCDGVFLGGHNVACDESSATGESNAMKKVSYDECLELKRKHDLTKGEGSAGGATGPVKLGEGNEYKGPDCFVLSGSKVLEGVGRYVVVAVGPRSHSGRILMGLRQDRDPTPLQLKLNRLAETIAKIGTAAGLLLFFALSIGFFILLGLKRLPETSAKKGIAFVNNLIISVTLIVVAVPEGLPLAVTLALSFATVRMTRENLLVRHLGSCETMANASVVCTDKTGTLTQNEMTVVAGALGINAKFVRHLDEHRNRTNADEKEGSEEGSEGASAEEVQTGERRHPKDFSIDHTQIKDTLSAPVLEVLNAAITINSTAFEQTEPDGSKAFVGNKTETALLKFSRELDQTDYREMRESANIAHVVPFSSSRKSMCTIVKLGSNQWRAYFKGASEILTKRCTRHIAVTQDGRDSTEIETAPVDADAKDNIQRTIIFYANQTLRTIAICYRDLPQWPLPGLDLDEEDINYDVLCTDLTLIAITGIEDPLRPGVREAVAKCQKAGVTVKMCTGDNVLTARSIALQCGIYTPGGIIIEGPTFASLSDNQLLAVVPRLQVLARSSPQDKERLVRKLKELGEIVGVTGDGTNDSPALTAANVGFSMGIAGTEVAKTASGIVLMDDNFASIVKAIMWGRCVNDSVRKFLQFQISTNVTAVVITFVTALTALQKPADEPKDPVLTAVQLLWINIIMDTFAALALATDRATEALLDRMPEKKNASLFTVDMFKQILLQSCYQILVIFIFHFLGGRILNLPKDVTGKLTKESELILKTLVFNAFVYAQIFNSVNCRRLDKKLNIFEGLSKNWYFIGITLVEVVGQICIVFVGGAAFHVARIGGREWGISVALGVVSIPLGALIRLLPNEPFEKLFKFMRLIPKSEELPTTSSDWSPPIDKVRDGLRTFSTFRGGRMRASSIVNKSRSAEEPQELPPKISDLLTMIPTLVVSGVTTNWKRQPGSLSDPAQSDPSRSSAALFEGNVEIHPETKEDDPAFSLFSRVKRATSPNV